MPVELRLFGGAALIGADGQLVAGAAAQPRRLAVLAVLADAWPSPVTRDRLVALLWPESDGGARRLLTQALYSLRRELGDFTRVSGHDVAIDADTLRVDLIEFRRALAVGNLDDAVALYRGPLLDGFHVRDAVEFERWTDGLRDATQRQLRDALDGTVKRLAASGEPREAARWAERRVRIAPFDADAVLQHMDLLEQAGDTNAALWTAASYMRRIREELELEPAPAIRTRAAALRARAAATVEESAVRRVTEVGRDAPDDDLPNDDAPDESRPARSAASPPITRSADVAPRRSPRRRIAVGAAVALVAGAGALVISRHSGRRADEAPAAHVVRLVPFELRGDSAAARAAASVATSVLVSALDGGDGARLRDSAARASDWATLTGTVAATSNELRLEAELRPASADAPIGRAVVTGPRDSLISLAERLSVQLLPALYARLAPAVPAAVVRRFHRADALKAYLEGESAWRRGAFGEAYDAFRASTTLDSTQAYTWYRRAVAAEESHRNPEADSSIAAARARDASLLDRERRLLDGYAQWRAGDAVSAERTFRTLVESQVPDREAWYHFAEIAYHAGPLLGRPIDGALDPWRRVVSLDSANVPALVHLVRLEARAGDSTAANAVLRRIAASGVDPIAAAESRVIAAYGTGDARRIAAVGRLLDTLPDYSLHFLHATVAGLLERPALARPIAARLTSATRPDAMRAEGHIALAHVAMAGGRWRAAWAELDSAAPANPAVAAWTRAYFATLPFLTLPDSVVADASRRLAGASRTPTAPLYLQLAVDAPAAPAIERYLDALLRTGARRDQGAGRLLARDAHQRSCDGLAGAVRTLCADLQRGVEAEDARRTGDPARALSLLEGMEMTVPYQFAGRSTFFARTRERWLRAELLAAQGRESEAFDWYAAVPEPSRYDYVYLAPSHLRRAELLERQGNLALAAVHYRKVIDLWRDADPDIAMIGRAAARGLRRVSAAR